MTSENENIFLDKIDCNFPYNDRQECLKLIDQASTLSTNALFGVVEEICRPPRSENAIVSTTILVDLLTLTKDKLNHPLGEIILDVADKMVHGQELTVDDAIAKMQLVKNYPGQFHALSILYFSCDDIDGKLEPVWDNILNDWKK